MPLSAGKRQAFIRLPAVAAANAPGVAATAPVPDAGGALPAYNTAGLVAQVCMTNLPVAVVPPVPETPPAEPPAGLEELNPKPCPAEGSARVLFIAQTAMRGKHCTEPHAICGMTGHTDDWAKSHACLALLCCWNYRAPARSDQAHNGILQLIMIS